MKNQTAPKSFQQIILDLQMFWSKHGCVILQPYDMEIGAGTFHPATALKAIGSKPWRAVYVQSCRRPSDGRYAQNPNRLQQYYQFQVVIKPSPVEAKQLYRKSLEVIGISYDEHDIRFVEDDWQSPTLGAAGVGWEVWCDGMEITQFTYFQQFAGIDCKPVILEITYGLERIAMYIQNVKNIFEIDFNQADPENKLKYHDVIGDNEEQYSKYNFEYADTKMLKKHFDDYESECQKLTVAQLNQPAYDYCIKANHAFNLLEARKAISVNERANYIGRTKNMVSKIAKNILNKKDANHDG